MRRARPGGTPDRDLCRGPARLTQALGITGAQNGIDLVRAQQGFAVVDDGMPAPSAPLRSPRIGIRVATDMPWRWSVPGSRFVSGPSRA